MNERIKELALDAGVTGYFAAGTTLATPIPLSYEMEKFAELIVSRCVQVCDGNHEYKNRTDTDFGKGVSMGILLSKEQIKAHFGIE